MTTQEDWLKVELNPADQAEAERMAHVSWAAVRARPHRYGGRSSFRTTVLGRRGELAGARYFDVRHPYEGLSRWPVETPDGTDLIDKNGKRWGVRCVGKSWFRLNLEIKDCTPQILVLGHEYPVMWIVGWSDPVEGRAVGQFMINSDSNAEWWAVGQEHLHPLPEQNGYTRRGPAGWLVDPQALFWDEACGQMHPIIEHRLCRGRT